MPHLQCYSYYRLVNVLHWISVDLPIICDVGQFELTWEGRQFSHERFRLDVSMYTCVLPIFPLRRASFPDLYITLKLYLFIFIHLFAQCRLPAITDPPRRSRIKGHNYRSSNSLDVPACVKTKQKQKQKTSPLESESWTAGTRCRQRLSTSHSCRLSRAG